MNKYINDSNINKLKRYITKYKKENQRFKAEVKTFSHLCEVMGIEVSKPVDSSTKQCILKELSEFAEIFKLKGSGYLINKVYTKKKFISKAKTLGGKQLDETIIGLCSISATEPCNIERVTSEGSFQLILSLTGLMKQCGLIGEDFGNIRKHYNPSLFALSSGERASNALKICNSKIEKLDLFNEDLLLDTIEDYNRKSKELIKDGLERLQKNKYIKYFNDIQIITHGGDCRLATKEEIGWIVDAELHALRELKIDRKDLFGKYMEYSRLVLEQISTKGIKNYYTVYKIIMSSELSTKVINSSEIIKRKQALMSSNIEGTTKLYSKRVESLSNEIKRLDFKTEDYVPTNKKQYLLSEDCVEKCGEILNIILKEN